MTRYIFAIHLTHTHHIVNMCHEVYGVSLILRPKQLRDDHNVGAYLGLSFEPNVSIAWLVLD